LANKISKVAIHDLNRTAAGFVVTLGKDQLAITKTMQRVIDDLYDLYSRRASKSHGKFSVNDDNFPTQGHLRTYVDGGLTDFATLTSKMMTTLATLAGQRNASTGGHVFFAQFERDGKQYLLVVIVTDKLGAALTKDFDIRDAEYLDMDGFRFAGRINITGWSNDADRYIGFLKGKGNVSEYFKEFLGCDTTIQERKDTADLVTALKKFADDQGMTSSNKDEFLSKAKTICDRYSRGREELEFQALANELIPASPETLLNVLTEPDLLLNDRFVPDRRALGSLVKIKGKTALWALEFDREALTGGKISYDAEDNTLTIRDLPPELTTQLASEIGHSPEPSPEPIKIPH
jgi:nucleoid-associated protein